MGWSPFGQSGSPASLFSYTDPSTDYGALHLWGAVQVTDSLLGPLPTCLKGCEVLLFAFFGGRGRGCVIFEAV